MKLRTKILAWLHIVPFAVGVLLLALGFLLWGSGALARLLKPGYAEPWLLSEVTGMVGVGVGFLAAAFSLINVLPWIFLLKQHTWAWWLLTVGYVVLTAVALVGLVVNYPASLNLKREEAEILGWTVLWSISLLILLTDRPPWHHKRRKRRRMEG